MKCQNCGKHIDEVDCSCKMCTLCGWSIDVKPTVQPEAKDEA